jgi:Ca2+-binding RTX toxin-like protein
MSSYVRSGQEFIVNSTIPRTQAQSDSALLTTGYTLVTWIDADLTNPANRIVMGKILQSNGTPLTSDIPLVVSNSASSFSTPSVAAMPGGGFAIAWNTATGLMVQSFGQNLSPQSAPIIVSNVASSTADLVSLSNGNFAVTWHANGNGSDIFLSIYTPAGALVFAPSVVNTTLVGNQTDPSITSLTNGNFVIVWADSAQLKLQLYNSLGQKIAAEIPVNAPSSFATHEPSVISLANGGFVVAWEQALSPTTNANMFQVFGVNGPVGSQIVILNGQTTSVSGPVITALVGGGFAMAWTGDTGTFSDGSGSGIFVQAFDSNGLASGAAQLVNSQTNGNQTLPAISALQNGGFIVSWTDLNGPGADDDNVRAQVFQPNNIGPMTVNLVADTGASQTDFNTSNSALQGTAEANAVITVKEGAILLGTTTASASGNWSFTPAGLTDGTHVLSVTQTNAGGSNSTSNFGFTLDKLAPSPTVTLLADSGASATDLISNNPALKGIADANAVVTIKEGAVTLGTTTTDASGNWNFRPTGLADGAHTFTVTQTDLAGNTGTTNLTMTLDTTAAPTIALVNDTGLSATDNITRDIRLTGFANPNSFVTISEGASVLSTVTTSATGVWSWTPSAITFGAHNITVAQTDSVGITRTSSLSLILDGFAQNLTVKIANDTGISATDGITSDATLSGSGEVGATIKISEGSTLKGTATVDAAGNWSITPTNIREGTNGYTITETDIAGNTTSATQVVSYDSLTPTPTISLFTDSGISSSDRITTSAVLKGTAEANSVVTIKDGAVTLGTTNANMSGNWSFTPIGLADGNHNFTVSQTDSAGNTGMANLAVTLDTTAPVPSIGLVSDTGSSASDRFTNSAYLKGTADANSVVTIKEGTTTLATATTDASGKWSFTPTGLGDGNHSFTVSQTDVAGNTGTANLVMTLDTTAPAPSVDLMFDTGGSASDGISNSAMLKGTAEANSIVIIKEGAVTLGTATTDASGKWSFAPTGLADGNHSFTVIQTDVAGNTGTANLALTLDTTLPVPTIALVADTGTSATDLMTSTAALKGTAESNSIVTILDGTTVLGTATASATGDWSFTPVGLIDGVHTLSVNQTDVAGNTGTANILVTLDATAPVLVSPLADQNSAEDAAINFTLPAGSFYDAGSTTLNYTATLTNGSALPAWLSFNAVTQTFTGTPPQDFNGNVDVKVTASDENFSTSDDFTLTITPINDAPIVAVLLADTSSPEDASFSFSIPAGTFTDIDNTALNYAATLANGAALPAWLSFNSATQTFSGTPPQDFFGSIDVKVVASDGSLTASDVFTLAITPINDAPVVATLLSDKLSNEDTAFSFVIPAGSFADVDNATLNYAATLSSGAALPSWLNFDASTQTFSGTPPQDFNGNIDVKVTASDGSLSASDVFTLTITPVNDAPIVAALLPDKSYAEDTVFSFVLPAGSFGDVDNATLSLSATLANGIVLPSWLNFNATTQTFSGTPPQDFNGNIDVKVTASDGSLSASDVFTLTITPVNDAPIVAVLLPDMSSAEDTAFNFTVPVGSFTDVDNATLTYSATLASGAVLPSWLIFNATTQTFSGTPPLNYNGNIDVKVTASDGSLSASDVFTLVITPVNDAPIAVNDGPLSLAYNTPLTVTAASLLANDTDVDSATLTINSVSNPSHGTVILQANGSIMFTPDADYIGAASFNYAVSDGAGGTATATATINVQGVAGQIINGTAAAETLTGTAGDDTINGLAGNDILNGNGGVDKLVGGLGNDTYIVNSVGDQTIELVNEGTDLVQSSISWTIGANLENLTLTGAANINGMGNSAINTITGNSGNNILNGAGGLDTLVGGLGDDTYIVDVAGVVTTEAVSAGTDTVQSSVTWTLGTNFENLMLTSVAAINGTGNTQANVITGNSADNILNGGTGADTLMGGHGNDTYVVDNIGDTTTENANEGTDLIQSSITWTMAANIENLTLTGTGAINGTGNILNNTVTGNTGANVLDGGAGADTLIGGLGNDTYVVDNVGDITTELAGGGTDLVQASLSWMLGSELDNLTLTGFANIDGTGNSLVNVITGNTGNNILNGGGGLDTLVGGLGDDTYVVDVAGVITTEAANAGVDTVQSSVTWTLAANLENLSLTGSAAINGTGNTLANTITGNVADNILNGGTGADTLIGGLGNDTYVVDNVGDITTEATNAGTDLVQSSVTWTLGANLENLTLAGTTAITGTGNGLDNILTGNAAANILNGGAGNDQLIGGAGNDVLTGGLGNDSFVFSAGFGKDTITDFTAGLGVTDELHLTLGTAFDTYAEVMAVATQVGANTLFTFSATDTLTLTNVLKATLVNDDFNFL